MRGRSALLGALGGEEGCRWLSTEFYARVGKDPSSVLPPDLRGYRGIRPMGRFFAIHAASLSGFPASSHVSSCPPSTADIVDSITEFAQRLNHPSGIGFASPRLTSLDSRSVASLRDLKLSSGKAHSIYPEATPERCTAVLLLDVDPSGVV